MALPVASRRLALLAALATAVAACSLGDSTTGIEEPQIANPRTATYAAAFVPPIVINQMAVRDSGLFFEDFTVGTGDSIVAADTTALSLTRVQVHYRLWLTNGTLVEERQPPEPPVEFTSLRRGAIINGWRAGLQGMRVGGRRRLVMSPLWGFGFAQDGRVPPNSILIFEITLRGITRF